MGDKYYVVNVAPRGSKPFIGKSYEYSDIEYGPVRTRSAALSGIARLVKNKKATGNGTQKKVSKPVALVGAKVNNIALVLDVSSSMSGILSEAVRSLNSNIETIKKESIRTGQKTNVSVYAFSSYVRMLRALQSVDGLTPIRENEVTADGMTALFDATGMAITDLGNAPFSKNDNVSYLVQVITDGGENQSSRFGNSRNSRPLTELMNRVQMTDLWTLTFLVPNGGRSTLEAMGIPAGNIAEWEASSRGVQTYTQQNTQSFSNYFGARSNGASSVQSFYTDLSALKPADVKNALNDISKNVRILQVTKEENIKDFVEKELGSYTPGSAFYQLMKDEKKVQAYKELLVMEKGKRGIFGGPDARQVLGIPSGQALKIKPGNHGNFDIFVQSTSLNRKLPRGTKLLVRV